MSSCHCLHHSASSCKHLVSQWPGQAMRGAGPNQEAQRCQDVVRHSAGAEEHTMHHDTLQLCQDCCAGRYRNIQPPRTSSGHSTDTG